MASGITGNRRSQGIFPTLPKRSSLCIRGSERKHCAAMLFDNLLDDLRCRLHDIIRTLDLEEEGVLDGVFFVY